MHCSIVKQSFISFLALVWLVAPSLGQGGRPGPAGPKTSSPTPPTAGAVLLADEPFRLESVGLSIRIPANSQIDSTRIAGRSAVQIRPPDTGLIVNIQTPLTSNEEATVKEALDLTIRTLQGHYGVLDPDQKEILETQATVLERTDVLQLNGGPAARGYVAVPRGDKTRVIKGYTIFKPSAKQYVIFELSCSEADFNKHRGMYETIVATAVFDNSDAMTIGRAAAIKAGEALLNSLTESDYLGAMGDKEVWMRWYKPAATGVNMDAQELGYRGVRFWRGQRGEINPAKTKASWSRVEQQDGYLAQVRARVILDKGVVDTVALYFMALDRKQETWNISTSVKDERGNSISSATEIGARDGEDLTVLSTAAGRPATTIKPPVPQSGYISQFENTLMPRLLARKNIQAQLGFYAFQRSSGGDGGSTSFRRDIVAAEGPEVLTITTTFREDMAAQKSTYAKDGTLIKIEAEQGTIWEPMDLTTLRRLWQNKGLPVDR